MSFKYKNGDLQNSLVVIFEQMKRYYTACQQEHNKMTAVEEDFNKRLLQKIEERVVEDTIEGGEHSYQYLHNRNQNILMVDNTAFCNYEATKGWGVLEKYGCPLPEKYDLITEGRKLHDLVDDFCSLSIKEFVDKHYIAPERVGDDKLLEHFEKMFADSDYTIDTDKSNQKRKIGFVKCGKREQAAFYQYATANPKLFQPSVDENGNMAFANQPLDHMEIWYGFKREEENFSLKYCTVELFYDKEETSALVNFKPSPERAKSFGKIFEETKYKEICSESKQPKKNDKNDKNNKKKSDIEDEKMFTTADNRMSDEDCKQLDAFYNKEYFEEDYSETAEVLISEDDDGYCRIETTIPNASFKGMSDEDRKLLETFYNKEYFEEDYSKTSVKPVSETKKVERTTSEINNRKDRKTISESEKSPTKLDESMPKSNVSETNTKQPTKRGFFQRLFRKP